MGLPLGGTHSIRFLELAHSFFFFPGGRQSSKSLWEPVESQASWSRLAQEMLPLKAPLGLLSQQATQ